MDKRNSSKKNHKILLTGVAIAGILMNVSRDTIYEVEGFPLNQAVVEKEISKTKEDSVLDLASTVLELENIGSTTTQTEE